MQKHHRENMYSINTDDIVVFSEEHLLCIRPTLITPVLQHYHNHITKVHNGRSRMYKDMKHRVHWPRMKKDVKKYCQSCVSCQFVIGRNQKHRILRLFSCNRPYQMIATDLIGPLPISSSDNCYMLTIIDLFSRMCRIVAIQDVLTTTIARTLLDHRIYLHGVSEKMLSDRGTHFTSHIFIHLCNVLGAKQTFTSPHHPETDGMIERLR